MYQKNQDVKWRWGNGSATGVVSEIYKKKVSLTIKGTEVTRDASKACPAYLIEQDNGDKVLKSHSEITAK